MNRSAMVIASLVLAVLGLGSGAAEGSSEVTLCGFVEGPEGPVEEAVVELRPVLDNYTRSRRLLHGEGRPAPATDGAVDTEGRYCLESPAPGVGRVVVKAPGFVPMRYFPLPLGDEAVVELPPVRLLPDARTRVRVSSPEGDAISAAVYALPGDTAPWKKAPSNGWNVASRFGWIETEEEIILPRAEGELLDLYVNPRGSDRLQRAREMEHGRFVLPEDPGQGLRLEVVSGGRPVADAVIGVGDIAWPVAMTDADGRATLAGLHRRLVPLVVLSKDGAVVRRTIDLRKLPADRTAEIRLPPAHRIGGRVSDDRGQPLPGALVWIGSDPGRFVRSGPEGEFHLTVAGGKRFWIQGHARGHLPAIRWVEAEGEDSEPLALQLDRALEVEGRVVDADGEPLPGTKVLVEAVEGSADRTFRLDPQFARVRSGPEGRFSIRLHDGESYALSASRPGYRAVRLRLEAERGGGPEEIVLRLSRHRSGWGRVVGPDERPLEGVTVWLLPAGSRDRSSLQARARRGELDPELSAGTDQDGVFRLAHLPASAVDLVAYRAGFAPIVVPGIEAGTDEGPTDLGTVVLREGVELEGRIVDPEGAPIGAASVWMLDPEQRLRRRAADPLADREPDGRSGSDGAFLLTDLAPGASIRLGVDAKGYRASVADLAEVGSEDADSVEIVLEETGFLRGKVFDPEDSPVAGARVTVHPKASEVGVVGPELYREPERTVLTDEEGTFELTELRPGRYEVYAYREGFLSSASLAVDVAPETPVDGIELRLQDGAVVEGWVLTETGRPVEGAVVLFGRPAARTGPDGAFVVEAVEPGTTSIEVRHADYVWHEETRELDSGFNVIELRLEEGASVTGATHRADGELLGGVNVRLSRDARPYREYSTRSRRDGTFRFESVQPGAYRVHAGRGALIQVDPKRRVDVGPEGLEDLVVRLRAGATIRGAIDGLELDELVRLRVLASNAERPSRRGRVDHSGVYRIESVAPGVWWVKAGLPDGTREAEARVVVEEGASEVVQDLDLGSGFELRGVVLVEGEPSPGVQIGLEGLDRSVSRRGRTDLGGRFEIGNLPEGRYRLTASDPEAPLIHNEVLRLFGDREITVHIEAGSVRGAVTSGATGEELKDVLVVLGQLEGAAGGEVSRVTVGTNGRGEFRITRLSAGGYRLAVRKDGYAPEVSTLEIAPGETRDLQVELKPADGLRIRVQRADGNVPPWAFVRLSDSRQGRQIEEIRPIEQGFLEIPTVPAGIWTTVLAAPESVPTELRVTVPGPPQDVTLAPAGKLRLQAPALERSGVEASVRILDASGRPISALDPVTGKLRSAWSWRRNGIVIDGIPAGQWVVQIEATDGATWGRTVTTRGAGEELVVVR